LILNCIFGNFSGFVFLIFVFVLIETVLEFSLEVVLVCCSFVLNFAIFSFIGSFKFSFGIWWSLDLYFGPFTAIKYYVSLNSIDDMCNKNTIKPKSKEKIQTNKIIFNPETFTYSNMPLEK